MRAETTRAGAALAVLALLLAGGAGLAQGTAGPTPDAPSDAPTGDVLAGKKIARTCSGCHGLNGIARNPEAANLAGQDIGYLTRQLQAFRSGERKHEVMGLIAHGLSDRQIADVATYYGRIEIQVGKTP